jgi:cytochrome c556
MLRWLAFGLALSACESAPQSAPERPEAAPPPHSADQLNAAADLQRAVVEGRLSDVHDRAAVIAEMPAVKESADRIAREGELASIGVEVGRVAQACGTCHAMVGVHGDPGAGPPPDAGTTLAEQMHRHAWGATRMWQGVSGPGDRAWEEGAEIIAETPLDLASAVHEKPNVEAFELAEQLRGQAERAGSMHDLESRAKLYGEMMETCASCHRIMRPAPVIDTSRESVARSR